MDERCQICGRPLLVGQWPCIRTPRAHSPVGAYVPFKPYFDIALGRQINSLADRWRAKRELHCDEVDGLSRGDLSAVHDRARERRRLRDQR